MCIDGSPAFLRKIIEKFVKTKDVTDEKIQLELISQTMRTIFPEERLDNIRQKMAELKGWENKLNKLIEFIRWAQLDINIEHLSMLCNGVYHRTSSAYRCQTDGIAKIKSPIVLLRPTDPIITDIDEDYELQKCTEGLVTLKYLDGNHQSLLENPKLVSIINEMDPNQESRKDFVNIYIRHEGHRAAII